MNEWLYDALIDPLRQTYFQKALIGGSLVGVSCGVIGCFVILRRMAFLGDALSHAMLAGVTAGYLFMNVVFGYDAHAPAMLIGSLIAGFVTVVSIGFVSKVSRIKEDTAIGIMYTGIFAVGGILASLFSDRIHIDLLHFVMGQVLAVEDADLWMLAFVAAGVLAIVILLFRQLQLTTFDPVMAASIGVPVVAMGYLLTTCTSFVVVSAVTIVGVILVVGLLVTPAASAYLLCDRLGWMLVLSGVFGVSSLYCSVWIDLAAGSAIVVVSTLQFLVVLMAAPRYGLVADWLRRRAMVPQQLVEDVLGCLRRTATATVPAAIVFERVESRRDQIERAIRWLERQDLLRADNGNLTLTDTGRREARRLLRAHRLWESYLQYVGTPSARWHDAADRLEHLHDEATVDDLDDKLGHPLHDPHGSEIPEDFVDLVSDKPVKASLLRSGHRATVASLEPAAHGSALAVGMHITAGPRREEDNLWTFLLPDGKEIRLDHKTVDAVIVTVARADAAT